MKYNPIAKADNYSPQQNRRSIRLKGYDYAQAGLYFVTICCQDREWLFGEIINNKMFFNDAGKNANECWLQIPNHFPNAILHEHVIMPNHVHGIIELTNPVGAKNISPENSDSQIIAKNISPENGDSQPRAKNISPLRSPSKTIGSIVRGFKIGVTKWFRNNMAEQFPMQHPVWQRNYYDNIIRNTKSYQNISEYIINNPLKWQEDKFYV